MKNKNILIKFALISTIFSCYYSCKSQIKATKGIQEAETEVIPEFTNIPATDPIDSKVTFTNDSETNLTDEPLIPTSILFANQIKMGDLDVDGKIEYEPNHSRWTKDLGKGSSVYLPKGTKIDNSNEGNWIYPLGTVIRSDTFSETSLIETRLMIKETNANSVESWRFKVFAWYSDSSGRVTPESGLELPSINHSIPSHSDCVQCHQATTSGVLGLNALHLDAQNDEVNKGTIHADYSELLTHPNNFNYDIPGTPIQKEVLGYLDANCGTCHNKNSSLANLNVLYKLNLNETSFMSTDIYQTNFNVQSTTDTSKKRIAPNSVENSFVVDCIENKDMPPNSKEADDDFLVQLKQMINQL